MPCQAKDALANWKRTGRRTPALARSIGELDAKDVHLPELQAKRVRTSTYTDRNLAFSATVSNEPNHTSRSLHSTTHERNESVFE